MGYGHFRGRAAVCQRASLVGSFEGGNSVSFGGGNTSASNEYTFAADGSYRQSGAVTSSVSSDRSTADVGGSGGRWQLAGWVLILTDDRG